MSGTLDNYPLEGDDNKNLCKEVPVEESKSPKLTIRKSKSLGPYDSPRVYYSISDYKNSGGVRLVWRTSSSADLHNLNKVLRIPSTNKRNRSPSPISPTKSVNVSNVFSEDFDPLAVQKRVTSDSEKHFVQGNNNSSNKVANDTKINQKKIIKRQEPNFKGIDMPSVKSLKHLFEKNKNESEDNKIYIPAKRSYTLSGHHFSSQRNIKAKYISKDQLQLSAPSELNKNISKEDFRQPVTSSEMKEYDVKDRQNIFRRSKSKSFNIEIDNFQPVKNLLDMFERSQSIPSDLKNVTMQNRKLSGTRESLTSSKNITTGVISHPNIETKNCVRDDVFDDKVIVDKPDIVQVSKIYEIRNVRRSSSSVMDMRKKWENLMSKSSVSQNKKQIKLENKTTSIKGITQNTSPTIVNDENEKTSKLSAPNKTEDEQQIFKQVEATNSQSKEDTTLKRNHKFRNSVKNIALIFEKQNVYEEKSTSAPPTPSTPNKEFILNNSNISNETLSPFSPITSVKINKHPPSRSLDNLRRKFSSDIEKTDLFISNAEIDKDNSTDVTKDTSEISLASLERKASVKNMKRKFEITHKEKSTEATANKHNETRKSISETSKEKDSNKNTLNENKPDVISKYLADEEAINMKYDIMKDEAKENEINATNIKVNLDKDIDSREYNIKTDNTRTTRSEYDFKREEISITLQSVNEMDINSGKDFPEAKTEMSIASLERKSSVKNMKKRYENTQKEEFTESSVYKCETTNKSILETSKENKIKMNFDKSNLSKISPDIIAKDIDSRGCNIEVDSTHTTKVENIKKKLSSDIKIDEVQKDNSEISLASLERKASVKNIKKRFETTQTGNLTETATVYKRETTSKLTSEMCKENVNVKEAGIKYEKNNLNSPDLISYHFQEIQPKNMQCKPMNDDDKKTEFNVVKIEVNNTEVDISSRKYDIDGTNNKSNQSSEEIIKMENIVKDFLKSDEGSQYLDVPKKECSSPSNSTGSETETISNLSQLMKVTDTLGYPDLGQEDNSDNRHAKDSLQFQSLPSLATEYAKPEKEPPSRVSVPAKEKIAAFGGGVRMGSSRELKPDELQFFKGLGTITPSNESIPNPIQGRERSLTIESSSPTSTLSLEGHSKSKLRSSTRQFRDLHIDELKFFGANTNGALSQKSSRISSEEGERKE